MTEVEFFGAAGEVTGSCHVLRVNERTVLLDCGMIQGGRRQQARNRDAFPFDVREIDAVILSHAHLDHSGRLPLLARRGYRGPIYTQNASLDLAEILLRDAASLAERDAERRNRKLERAGSRLESPLFTEADARNAVLQMSGIAYRKATEVLPGLTVRFLDAGHILGSAIVELTIETSDGTRVLVFSGDLGQYDTPVLRDPAAVTKADLVIMESTYGDRRHRERADTIAELGDILASASNGNVIVPAFAVGRSQELMYLFGKYYRDWDMQRFRIFLDSPLAIAASHIYWDYPHLYDEEATRLRRGIDDMPPLPNLHFTETAAQSRLINRKRSGAIVIAGSGMCTGGRVLHHLKHNLWRPETHVLITGYQAEGSLGRKLVDGARYVTIHGDRIRNRAAIHTVGGLSAHGDQADMLRWYKQFSSRPPVCLVHGEPQSTSAFAHVLSGAGAKVTIPGPGQRVTVS